MARALAVAVEAPLQLACVDAARKSHQAISSGNVDLVFLAIDPAREDAVTFTAPYVIIEGVYVPMACPAEAAKVYCPNAES
jgi:polar amino acid transport system substrate-binding protein